MSRILPLSFEAEDDLCVRDELHHSCARRIMDFWKFRRIFFVRYLLSICFEAITDDHRDFKAVQCTILGWLFRNATDRTDEHANLPIPVPHVSDT